MLTSRETMQAGFTIDDEKSSLRAHEGYTGKAIRRDKYSAPLLPISRDWRSSNAASRRTCVQRGGIVSHKKKKPCNQRLYGIILNFSRCEWCVENKDATRTTRWLFFFDKGYKLSLFYCFQLPKPIRNSYKQCDVVLLIWSDSLVIRKSFEENLIDFCPEMRNIERRLFKIALEKVQRKFLNIFKIHNALWKMLENWKYFLQNVRNFILK